MPQRKRKKATAKFGAPAKPNKYAVQNESEETDENFKPVEESESESESDSNEYDVDGIAESQLQDRLVRQSNKLVGDLTIPPPFKELSPAQTTALIHCVTPTFNTFAKGVQHTHP